MIKKYKTFLNEKLTDNLKGFDEKELKQQFLDGEIEIVRYFNICKKYNLKMLPSELDLKNYFNNYYVSLENYLKICKNYNYELPTIDEIHNSVSKYKNYSYMLVVACEYGFLDLVKKSIENGSEYHINNYEPMSNAGKNGNIEIVKYLLEHGAENRINNAFSSSVRYKNYDLFEYLLEHGVIIDNDMFDMINNLNDKKLKNIIKKYYNKQHDK